MEVRIRFLQVSTTELSLLPERQRIGILTYHVSREGSRRDVGLACGDWGSGRERCLGAALHGYLLGRPVRTAADRRHAGDRYARLVACVPDANLWDSALRQQIYLGDEAFVERMQALAQPRNSTDDDIPKIQRRKSRTLAQWMQNSENREQALYNAHTQGAMTMSAIARELGLSISRVSRLIARAEEAKGKA